MDFGGLERIVFELISNNKENGYSFSLCSLDTGGYFFEKLRGQGLTPYLLNRKQSKFDFAVAKNLVKLIRKHRIDVIHSHSGTIFYSTLCGKLGGVRKIIHTEHGRYRPDDLGEIWEDKICARFVDDYVVVSKKLYDYMLRIVGVDKKKLRLVMNGISLADFHRFDRNRRSQLRAIQGIEQTDIVLGVVGRFVPEKNMVFMIDWFRENQGKWADLKLVMVGDGVELNKAKNYGADIPEGRLRFMGARQDVTDLLNIFDIFALPSLTEGTSLTILEAMATGLPVVASNVGGNGALVSDGKSGFLFEPNDMESFDEKMGHLISDRELREKMGRRGRELVEKHFSLERMLGTYYQMYSEA